MHDNLMFEHRETEQLVEYVGTFQRADEGIVVRFACECGQTHELPVLEFMMSFEYAPPIRTINISAHEDDPVWPEVEAVLSKHGMEDIDVVSEDDDTPEEVDAFEAQFGRPIGSA